MPVMKGMRDIIKPVMWIVVIAVVGTIVLVWGGDITKSKYKKGIIGSVNGQEISAIDFSNLYDNQLKQLGKESEELDEQTTKQVLDNTWDNLVNEILVQQQTRKLGIAVSDKELFEYMKIYPPLEFQQSPDFQTDGKFDYQKYMQALANPQFPWWRWEGYIRSNLITLKLQEMIVDLVRVTDPEVKQEYVNDNEKVKVNYLFIPSSEFLEKVPPVTEQEIEKYYKENQGEFKAESRASLNFVVIPKVPTPDDMQKTKSDLLRIKMEAEQGEDFATLAQYYSDDKVTAEKGGDLGWFTRGKLIESFEQAAFSLKVGEISQPIRTEYGWHLIKLLEKRGAGKNEELHASHILLKISASEHTIDSLKVIAEDLAKQATKMGLKEAARQNNLNFSSADFFFRDSIIPGMGYNLGANLFAFENKAGKISDPIETKNGFYVVEVKDRKPAGIYPLDEVKQKIKDKIALNKAGDLALEEAQRIYQEAEMSKSLEIAANKFNQRLQGLDYFSRSSKLTQVDDNPRLVGTVFSLNEKNKISPPLRTENGIYLIEFISRIPISEEKFAQAKDSLYQQLVIQKKTQAYQDWFEQIKKKAKIEDYRNRFYKTE
ncbi:MAG: peptidylprolyl isomerase [candidate division Zixibacteria bacterium]|nr:peptidylprolyl isomerase [candidate division Zixibacteria bacterium]